MIGAVVDEANEVACVVLVLTNDLITQFKSFALFTSAPIVKEHFLISKKMRETMLNYNIC